MGVPPDASSILFWGRNRATTLMLFAFDMVGEGSWSDWFARITTRVFSYHDGSTLALVGEGYSGTKERRRAEWPV